MPKVVSEERKRRSRGAMVLLFASLAILSSITRLHGTPAFLTGVSGAVMVVVGIVLIAKKPTSS